MFLKKNSKASINLLIKFCNKKIKKKIKFPKIKLKKIYIMLKYLVGIILVLSTMSYIQEQWDDDKWAVSNLKKNYWNNDYVDNWDWRHNHGWNNYIHRDTDFYLNWAWKDRRYKNMPYEFQKIRRINYY
jgi:hypothetical protein